MTYDPASAPQPAEAPSGMFEAFRDPGKLRTLIVDADPATRQAIAQALSQAGHRPTECATADAALAAFRARPFPLVITDNDLGTTSGLELLREIQRIDPEALVVIMTRQASLDLATTAFREGAYDFLTKPFSAPIFISALVERAIVRLALQSRNRLLMHQLEMYARELERVTRNLKDDANKDWLTGLFNARHLRTALDTEIARGQRHRRKFAMILLDVDHFKVYNDTHGHLAGDEVLRGIAKLLLTTARSEDLCARYGGEEFVVLMPETDRDAALMAAERIRRRIETHSFEGGDTQPHGAITVSLGVACFPDDGIEREPLIDHADTALYAAKEKGRNCVGG